MVYAVEQQTLFGSYLTYAYKLVGATSESNYNGFFTSVPSLVRHYEMSKAANAGDNVILVDFVSKRRVDKALYKREG